jgi:acetate kinase
MNGPMLILNCGSSSIKFALFDARRQPLPRKPLWGSKVEGIGKDKPYPAALHEVHASVVRQTGGRPPAAIGHRVVHGGAKYAAPVRVDAAVVAELKSYIPLAPLHQPVALEAIEVLLAELPRMPQVACFDTAFHRTLRYRALRAADLEEVGREIARLAILCQVRILEAGVMIEADAARSRRIEELINSARAADAAHAPQPHFRRSP